jgi:hypothetical protein
VASAAQGSLRNLRGRLETREANTDEPVRRDGASREFRRTVMDADELAIESWENEGGSLEHQQDEPIADRTVVPAAPFVSIDVSDSGVSVFDTNGWQHLLEVLASLGEREDRKPGSKP